MKKIIVLIAFLVTSLVNAQGGSLVDAVKFRGEITTTIRDTFNVPTGEHWLIWNITTNQLEIAGDDNVWSILQGGSGSTYTAGTGLTESPTGTFNVNETYLNGVYLPLSGGVMSGDIDFESNGNVYDISYLSATSASISTLNGTSAILTGDLELTGGSISVYGSGIFDRISYRETDIEPIGSEGKTYWDDSENRLKAYDGTSWKAFLLDGDVTGGSGSTDDQTAAEVTYDNTTSGLTATDVQGAIDELESLTGGSASLTGYHSMLELTANGTASYANQVTGSGYRVINEVKGTTDIDVTINNLRSSLVNENYSFVSNSENSIIELIPGTMLFVGKSKGTNNAARATDYGSINAIEIEDGVMRLDGEFEWFTYSGDNTNRMLSGTVSNTAGNTTTGTPPNFTSTGDGTDNTFNRTIVTIPLATNNLAVGDVIVLSTGVWSGSGVGRIEVNLDNATNTAIAVLTTEGTVTGTIPSGVTDLSVWLYSDYNNTNSGTKTYNDVSLTKQ